jgi:hypothetical protein
VLGVLEFACVASQCRVICNDFSLEVCLVMLCCVLCSLSDFRVHATELLRAYLVVL